MNSTMMNCQNPACNLQDPIDTPSFSKCSACKKVSYCSKICQVAHWRTHKPICRSIKNSSIPDIDDLLHRLDELRPALLGRHAPVEQRIIYKSTSDPDEESRHAKLFADSLDVNDVVRYSAEKFIATQDKGAVVFNIKYPYQTTNSEHYSRLFWIPRQSFLHMQDLTLITLTEDYDPTHSCIILFALPSSDTTSPSVKIWSRKFVFSLDPVMARQVATTKRIWIQRMDLWRSRGQLRVPN